MSTKEQVVYKLVGPKASPKKEKATAFCPANIALIKYWGKRNSELNLPVTSSLSLSLAKGTHTTIQLADEDRCTLNEKVISPSEPFAKRLFTFCDLFRTPDTKFAINTTNEVPTAAGLASSSSGFAAVVVALNELYGWQKDPKALSILARMGSGSASRSIYSGFVEWHRGNQDDGMDSFSEPIACLWPELELGALMISEKQKPIDSREAMKRTKETSTLYRAWPEKVAHDMQLVKQALSTKDFTLLGSTAETNALSMHATMMGAIPPVLYWLPDTVRELHHIWQLRKSGLELYCTMDAGPNLKLLYKTADRAAVQQAFPHIAPISTRST